MAERDSTFSDTTPAPHKPEIEERDSIWQQKHPKLKRMIEQDEAEDLNQYKVK